jgi:hypothetical protein
VTHRSNADLSGLPRLATWLNAARIDSVAMLRVNIFKPRVRICPAINDKRFGSRAALLAYHIRTLSAAGQLSLQNCY